MSHELYKKTMQDLQFAQYEAIGALKGHVAFMLICHKHGRVENRHWEQLRAYHDAANAAAEAVLNHALKPVQPAETMQ